MEDLKKLKKIIFLSTFFLIIFNMCIPSFSYWYEEPVAIEKKDDIDSMWWLSKKKKEKLKKEREEELERLKEENKSSNNIKWICDSNDLTKYPKDKWEVIDDDNDNIGYNYYFDKNGYLLRDTITPDFKIVDKNGREIDINLKPVEYDMALKLSNDDTTDEKILDKADLFNPIEKEPAKVIIGEGVVLKEKQKIYDNSIDKNLLSYIDTSYRFIKETKGTTYNKIKWKKCSSLKGNGGYIVFNNPNNNFNKVTVTLSIEEFYGDIDTTDMYLIVYDADIYDDYNNHHHLEDIEEIYKSNNLSGRDAEKISFLFDRSVKRLRFEVLTEGTYLNRNCLIKDIKYGFNKTRFVEELERKKEEEEEIEYLKLLGIWVDDFESFVALDENGEEIEEDEEEHENENLDDEIGGTSYEDTDETESYEDKLRDRSTGPAFDNDLKNEHTWRDSGPAFVNESGETTIK